MSPNWFIALPANGVAGLDRHLAGCPSGLRRFHPDDLHVTVAFLGAVGKDHASAAWRELGELPAAPLYATLGRLRPFGNPRRPGAIAFELCDAARVGALLIAKQNLLRRAAGLHPETRPVRPHITVARPGRRADGRLRAAALAWTESTPPAQIPLKLSRIALYTWAQDRRQRLFTMVDSRAF